MHNLSCSRFFLIKIITFSLLVSACQWEKNLIAEKKSSTSFLEQNALKSKACQEVVNECLNKGYQFNRPPESKKDLWQNCIVAKAEQEQNLPDLKITTQQAATCWEAAKAIHGKRYWFNSLNFGPPEEQ